MLGQLRSIVSAIKRQVILFILLVLFSFTLALAPYSIAQACESGGASCHCPGC